MRIEPFRPDHLALLALQPAQAYMGPQLTDLAYGKQLAAYPAFTALQADRVLGCAGLVPQWEGRAIVWALLAADIGRGMVVVHRAVDRFLSLRTERRIEATCDHSFGAASRWLLMLGFQHEGTMRAFTPDGHDHDLYARVQQWQQ